MKTVNVHEAKTHLSRLLDRAHAGEEIVIAKSGKPYAKLTPNSRRGRRDGLPAPSKDVVKVTDAFFAPLPRGWNGEG